MGSHDRFGALADITTPTSDVRFFTPESRLPLVRLGFWLSANSCHMRMQQTAPSKSRKRLSIIRQIEVLFRRS